MCRRHPISFAVLTIISGACGTAHSDDPFPEDNARLSPDSGALSTRPWAHNTGPTDPAALASSSGLTVTTDGAVIENLDIRGRLTIDADNVTVRNFRIDAGDSHYCIFVETGHENILIEDGELTNSHSAAINAYSPITAKRLHIHDHGADGLKISASGSVVESSFIEKLGGNPGSHADGVQQTGRSNTSYLYNNFFMPKSGTPAFPGGSWNSNATIFLETPFGKTDNVVIEGNWLDGGNYTIYCSDFSTNVSVTNNFFGRNNGGWPDNVAGRIKTGNCDNWSNNRWEDTGELIP